MFNGSDTLSFSQLWASLAKQVLTNFFVLFIAVNALAADATLICTGKLTEIAGPLSYLDGLSDSQRRAVEVTDKYRFAFLVSEEKIDQLSGVNFFSAGKTDGCATKECFCDRTEKEQICFWSSEVKSSFAIKVFLKIDRWTGKIFAHREDLPNNMLPQGRNKTFHGYCERSAGKQF